MHLKVHKQVASDGYLDDLNDQQYKAVIHDDTALLVLSGAGTGKTRVITTRVAYLLNNALAYPSQILAVTFSNRAALEMKNRLLKMVGDKVSSLWLGTFHSICLRILKKHAELVGLSPEFAILDRSDQEKIAKQILVSMNKDKKQAISMIDKISRLKDKGITIFDLSHYPDVTPDVVRFYRQYQTQLFSYNSVDFSDLILYVVRIFQEHSDVLSAYKEKFKYILVDEYQDTNTTQYLLLRLLSPTGKGLCCVGDDDQSIYSWRGAEINNILSFSNDFPVSKILKLEQNYRSTEHIIGAANGLIMENTERHEKHLWTESTGGDKVIVVGLETGYDEARYVATQIENMKKRRNIKYQSMAVLVRASFQTRELEEVFLSLGIPYKVVGGPKFYDRKEIRDILAYMRLTYQLHDGLALERVLNTPKRGLGDGIMQKLNDIAIDNSCSLFTAISIAINNDLVRATAKAKLKDFINMIQNWRQMQYSPSVLAHVILEETGYLNMLKEENSIESEARCENIKELLTALEVYDDLGVFLEHISLVTDDKNQREENLVSLMTLHSSKGLEFDLVFLCGLEEGIFPHQLSVRSGGLEEERRLAYVGMTRAKKTLFITFAHRRRLYSQWQINTPSRFLRELPKEHIFALNSI